MNPSVMLNGPVSIDVEPGRPPMVSREPRPGRHAIEQALAGNLCRRTGCMRVIDAVEVAAAVAWREAAVPAPPSGGAVGLPATRRVQESAREYVMDVTRATGAGDEEAVTESACGRAMRVVERDADVATATAVAWTLRAVDGVRRTPLRSDAPSVARSAAALSDAATGTAR